MHIYVYLNGLYIALLLNKHRIKFQIKHQQDRIKWADYFDIAEWKLVKIKKLKLDIFYDAKLYLNNKIVQNLIWDVNKK